jgi:hypothetical protein
MRTGAVIPTAASMVGTRPSCANQKTRSDGRVWAGRRVGRRRQRNNSTHASRRVMNHSRADVCRSWRCRPRASHCAPSRCGLCWLPLLPRPRASLAATDSEWVGRRALSTAAEKAYCTAQIRSADTDDCGTLRRTDRQTDPHAFLHPHPHATPSLTRSLAPHTRKNNACTSC